MHSRKELHITTTASMCHRRRTCGSLDLPVQLFRRSPITIPALKGGLPVLQRERAGSGFPLNAALCRPVRILPARRRRTQRLLHDLPPLGAFLPALAFVGFFAFAAGFFAFAADFLAFAAFLAFTGFLAFAAFFGFAFGAALGRAGRGALAGGGEGGSGAGGASTSAGSAGSISSTSDS